MMHFWVAAAANWAVDSMHVAIVAGDTAVAVMVAVVAVPYPVH